MPLPDQPSWHRWGPPITWRSLLPRWLRERLGIQIETYVRTREHFVDGWRYVDVVPGKRYRVVRSVRRMAN